MSKYRSEYNYANRPEFPERAVITGGMPYGNKELHFGHIGGVFCHADVLSRFLKDRIGKNNVIFVSGTDGYGSPIVVSYKKLVENSGYKGTLEDFVMSNHNIQKQTLKDYSVDLSLFAVSSFSPFKDIHQELGAEILTELYKNGHLIKRSTLQFYDNEHETFLNGRQVTGQCPIQGCNSEEAYADECSLGHQYEPEELLNPISILSGKKPELKEVTNWYLDQAKFRELLLLWLDNCSKEDCCRRFAISTMLEFFEPPLMHITKDQIESLNQIKDKLPPHTEKEGRGKSLQLVFNSLEELNEARTILSANSIRYRTGKTLVPFRMTGNLEWGLPVPEIDGLGGLTFWCWPESLWAPISFSKAYFKSIEKDDNEWKKWWCSHDSKVYQVIGEDNVFFYGLPEMSMFLGMQGKNPTLNIPEGQLQLPTLVTNKHILFLDKKASSSGKVKPPMAKDLLDYYTSDQLRIHFFSMGLGLRSTSFRPKPLNVNANEKEGDPVLKEGNLLSNAFNKAVRSCFYTTQKFYNSIIPVGEISPDILEASDKVILEFESIMHKLEFHQTVLIIGDYIRDINQRWSQSKAYADDCEESVRKQALIDAWHMVRTAAGLLHSIAPVGTEMIRDYLNVDESLWSWENIFEPVYFFMKSPETHELKFLEPRVDFFEKHPSQVKEF